MTDCSVRHASISDLDVLVPLFDAYRQFYRQPSDLSIARSFLHERFRLHQSTILLAEAASAAVGFTQLFPSFSSTAAAPILILNDLFVSPEARGRGIGRALLDAAARYGRATGAVRLTLSTEITNTSAQALYERQGWQRSTQFYVYNLKL